MLNSALAIAFFSIKADTFLLPVAILGFVVCILWFRVALGSKFWQSRWEQSIHDIEKRYIDLGLIDKHTPLFSLSIEQATEHVKRSLHFSEHTGFSRWLDTIVLEKPSVTQAMFLLVATFAISWLIIISFQLFKLVGCQS